MSELNPQDDEMMFGPPVGLLGSDHGKVERFAFENADEVTRRDAHWLVKGLWPRRGVCFLAGPSMSGKSFWILEQVSRIAKGERVLGRRSEKVGAAYIAAEGANGVRARLEGLRSRVGSWGGLIHLVSEAPDLASLEDVQQLGNCISRIKRDVEPHGQRLGLVVLDTLSASMPGSDENSGKDMSKVLQSLQNLAQEHDICVVVVAHIGKDAERGIRGWSGLLANADGAIIVCPPNNEGVRTGIVTKVKDGESGDKFAFGLETVDLGLDVDGDPVTTCVVVERDIPLRQKRDNRSKAGAESQMILTTYKQLSAELVPLPSAIGARSEGKGLRIDVLRSKTFELGFHAETQPAEDESELEKRRWVASRTKAFQRALHKLIEAGLIKQQHRFVWAP